MKATDSTSPIDHLIAALCDPAVEVRWQAAGELAALGSVAVAPLLTLLDTVDWSVRHIVVWALGEMHEERAIGTLIALLEDDCLHVRLSAARALEKSVCPAAQAALATWKAKMR